MGNTFLWSDGRLGKMAWGGEEKLSYCGQLWVEVGGQ